MKRVVLLLSSLAAASCDQGAGPVREQSVPALGSGSSAPIAVAAPGQKHADWIRPAKASTFAKPARPRNDSEDALWGTWVARVGDLATRSAFMAERVMFSVQAKPGQDGISAIVDALANDAKLASNCIWLELEADFTGIRRECAVVGGEPSALDETDPLTGAKKDLGARLEWYFETAAPAGLRIRFAADMVAPMATDGALRHVVYRDATLELGKKVGDNQFEVTESFPEHGYTLPAKYVYEIFPRRFVGR